MGWRTLWPDTGIPGRCRPCVLTRAQSVASDALADSHSATQPAAVKRTGLLPTKPVSEHLPGVAWGTVLLEVLSTGGRSSRLHTYPDRLAAPSLLPGCAKSIRAPTNHRPPSAAPPPKPHGLRAAPPRPGFICWSWSAGHLAILFSINPHSPNLFSPGVHTGWVAGLLYRRVAIPPPKKTLSLVFLQHSAATCFLLAFSVQVQVVALDGLRRACRNQLGGPRLPAAAKVKVRNKSNKKKIKPDSSLPSAHQTRYSLRAQPGFGDKNTVYTIAPLSARSSKDHRHHAQNSISTTFAFLSLVIPGTSQNGRHHGPARPDLADRA